MIELLVSRLHLHFQRSSLSQLVVQIHQHLLHFRLSKSSYFPVVYCLILTHLVLRSLACAEDFFDCTLLSYLRLGTFDLDEVASITSKGQALVDSFLLAL